MIPSGVSTPKTLSLRSFSQVSINSLGDFFLEASKITLFPLLVVIFAISTSFVFHFVEAFSLTK